jgi:hypothetical protein
MKTDFQEVEWEVMDWMNLIQNRDKWRIYMKKKCKFGLHKM